MSNTLQTSHNSTIQGKEKQEKERGKENPTRIMRYYYKTNDDDDEPSTSSS